jgi:hypothetical protein
MTIRKAKSPAGIPRGFFIFIGEEEIPSLAGLAATYSSKP